jgi:hypothetical protein
LRYRKLDRSHPGSLPNVLGQVAGGEAVTSPESIYTQLRDDHVARMIALRDGSAERELIQRMVARHEIQRNGPTESIAARQMSLALGQLPSDFLSRRRGVL